MRTLVAISLTIALSACWAGLLFGEPSPLLELGSRISIDTRRTGSQSISSKDVLASVSRITNPTTASVTERVRAASELGQSLAQDEIGRLFQFLKSKPDPGETNLRALQLIKNEVLNNLRKQEIAPVGLTDTLIDIYRNPEQDPVLRDYAIQHLVYWYETPVSEQQTRIRTLLIEAAQTESSIAGTALLGMHRLSATDSGFNGEQINRLALQHVLSGRSSSCTRATALQVCAERGVAEALPTIESLAQDATDLTLRLSAVAALGRLGTAEHINSLKQLDCENNEPLRLAVLSALQRLIQKQQVFYP